MPAKKPPQVMDFAKEYLGKNPAAEYAEFRDAAAKKGITVFPIVYGRAKALLGLVPTAPRGSGKRAKKKASAARRAVARTGSRTSMSNNALDTLGSLVTAMKKSEQDRERYKKALEKISKIIHEIV